MSKLEQIEELIGSNLQLLRDKLDLNIRQGDIETIQALQAITDGWREICVLMNAERWLAITGQPSGIVDKLYRDYTLTKGMKQ